MAKTYYDIITKINNAISDCMSEKVLNIKHNKKHNIYGTHTVINPTTGESYAVYYNSYVSGIYAIMSTMTATGKAIESYITNIFNDDGRLTGYAQTEMNFYNMNGIGSAFSSYDIYNKDTDTFTDAPEFEQISEDFLSTIGKVDEADYLNTYYNNTITNLITIMNRYKTYFANGDYEDTILSTTDNSESGSTTSQVIPAETKFWDDYASKFKAEVASIVENADAIKNDFTTLESYIYTYISYGQTIMEKLTALTNFITAHDQESALYSDRLAMFDETGYSIMKDYNETVGYSFQAYAEAIKECVKAPRVVNGTEENVTQFISNVAYYKYLNANGFYSWSKSTEATISAIMKRYKLL